MEHCDLQTQFVDLLSAHYPSGLSAYLSGLLCNVQREVDTLNSFMPDGITLTFNIEK